MEDRRDSEPVRSRPLQLHNDRNNLSEKAKRRMTHTKKVRTRTIVLCALAVCTLLPYALLPEVLSASWHFLHGNSVRFGAWEVPVPWGWYREINGKDAVDFQRAERWSPS